MVGQHVQVRKDIQRSYYDSTYGGVDIAARFARAEQGIQRASSLGELFGHVAAAVAELDDSHTFFIPPRQTVRAFYGWEMGMIGDSCFVTHVTPDSDADSTRHRRPRPRSSRASFSSASAGSSSATARQAR